MSDTKLDDETEPRIEAFGDACQEYEAANGSTTSPEYIEAVQGAESTLAALRDRVRELGLSKEEARAALFFVNGHEGHWPDEKVEASMRAKLTERAT